MTARFLACSTRQEMMPLLKGGRMEEKDERY
jgi:hypothetical protein